MTDADLAETEKLLRAAYEKLTVISSDEPIRAATTRLVECALEAVTMLGRPRPDQALEMMSCARAAVTAATHAVREVDGRTRHGMIERPSGR